MTLASDLKTVLTPDRLALPHGDGFVLEDRRDRRAPMRVRIVNAPPATAVIRLERVGHSRGLRDGPWKRICDYLLVVDSDERPCTVFVELKKTRTEAERPREQLRRSLPLLKYLRSVCDVEAERGDLPDGSIRYWIIFAKDSPRLDKQPVRAEPVGRERYKDLTIGTFIGDEVPFSTLTGA